MDSTRFDAWTKRLAQPANRRTTLRRLGGSLIGAVSLGVFARPVAAQPATPGATPAPGPAVCAFGFEATVRQGPDAGHALAGTLLVAIEAHGAIDHGALLSPTAAPVPVVGQVTGRAVNLLFTLGAGQVIYGVGTAQHPVAGCQPGALGGPLVGPAPGDSGDWTVLQLQATPGTADACSQCLDANNCTVRPGTDACKSCLANYCR